MGIRGLRDLKKNNDRTIQREHIPCLILGADLYAKLAWRRLRQEYGDASVRLLSDSTLEQTPDRFPRLNDVRSHAEQQVFAQLFPNSLQETPGPKNFFYKDQKFREFGGRSRPESLLEGEAYFSTPFQTVDLASFSLTDDEKTQIQSRHLRHIIRSIHRLTEANAPAWEIRCSDDWIFTCDRLILAQAPSRFLKECHNRDVLPSAFYEWCLNAGDCAALSVRLQGDLSAFPMDGTVFIPQSFTNEWGHFMCECRPQSMHAFTFLREGEVTPDDIAKKVHLIRRTLERLFPECPWGRCVEHIAMTESFPRSHIDDANFRLLGTDLPPLRFIGEHAPLLEGPWDGLLASGESTSDIRYLTRGLISILTL